MNECHGLDTDKTVFFYEHEFYVLSNFSSFALEWKGKTWMTSEHAYHGERFDDEQMKQVVYDSKSAHDAMKYAYANKDRQRKDWDDIKVAVMKQILHAKVAQHPYVKKKLLETGSRELVEDSWRDDFWGWGPHKNGRNQLGKLWMEVRSEIS